MKSGDERHLTPRALAVTRYLLMHGPSTRADLAGELQLSDASLSRVARLLVEQGIVTEHADRGVSTTGATGAAIGRPRQILTAVPGSRHVVGVKLTGDTAYAVLCDLAGTVLATASKALPEPEDGVVPVAGAVRVVRGLVTRLGRPVTRVDGLGVSVGGVVEGRSVVRDGVFLGWRGVDLGALLTQACGLPVVLSNDVVGLAREQLWFGAGRTHATFGVVTVGAGLGYAVVREGQVLEHLIDNGHLLSHSPLDASGPVCRQGHHGCVSAYLDRTDVAARLGRSGSAVSFEQLAQLDPDWFTGAARALGHLIATVAGGLQTERIVLAGEDVATLYADPVTTATLAARLRPGDDPLQVSTEPLGFTDWARGAAVVGIQAVLGAL
ncbi:ROK family transcriptional regulator [Kineosporia rhizophila]|uniref:ROK family transcriptional regulator n=1 Tax=Kineosporia TaxID=49184 RepID=UPI001E4085BE|nr:ROK family transcriptional regulator [Kineosporia sp. NBRC 101677]MCE0537553.1 ROK family transcriptional regulator [Kineosporia rhizophila]GLY18942.1 MarR family transcriptional regulator [Kineosporia sp. NBRC 101677]